LNGRKISVGVLLSGRERFGPYYGGALARWTYEVYRRLSEDVDVRVLGYPTPRDDRYPVPHQTHPVWRLCNAISHIPLARRYEERLWLRALPKEFRRFDVLHIHNRPQWAGILRDLGFRGAILLHLQNDHLGHWTADMLDALATRVEAVAVCSQYLRNTFAPKSSALAAKAHVVFNGVNTELFHPREEVREPKTIFFVGRFDPEKGILFLVQAYVKLLNEHPDAKLVIGGATGFGTHQETGYVRQVHALARSIQAKGRGRIEFPGYIHHDRDLPSWFQRATVFVSPSVFKEPFGLVNAEGMACGTPVIGSNRGGIPEVLGDTGRLVNPEDVDELASKIAGVLANAGLRRELGRASLERARRLFDWPVIAQQWATLLRQTVERRLMS
jgi:spore coat protein SA